MSGENDSDSEVDVIKKRLKAAIHFAVGSTCQEVADRQQISFQKKVLAVMTEAAWKYSEMMARDLELFAQHAKRNTVSVEDVKMIARKSPKLHELMTNRANEMGQKKQK
ncbi:DgyrCDS7812 [Dimorphilus gyrociliatus]|uniref:Centromere protein S n=1 Tax=Dimorphilus gyrociliatus TaxID=2664684 RepID=A0A7I8VX47_9ANNE|nr:DgyrCDS7812 [Dimorphilus gyrociliatus]